MEPSEFWKYINEGSLSMEKIRDTLPEFKRSETNFTLSMYDPEKRGRRYHAAVLYLMVKDMPDSMWAKLEKIEHRTVGSPLGIVHNNEIICLDYLQAVYELDFMEHVYLDGKQILEIGAGYGRTCHTIISNHDVKSYAIFDLGNCLALAHRYLSEVLTEKQFEKVDFINVEDYGTLPAATFDFALCIDAMSEMSEDNTKQYLRYINDNCSWFYTKGPMGQYDVGVDFMGGKKKLYERNLTVNEQFDRINVLDNTKVKTQIPKFVKIHRPASNWECVNDAPALPFMHYHQALYKK